jgi:GTP 3',8-cyclase
LTVTAAALVDPHGRTVRDLRVSVTDRCDLRCTYCMPAEGLPWLPTDEVLTFAEIATVARVAVERFGFRSVRITGGEPLVRHGLPDLVGRLAALGVDVALTTNGVGLARHASALARSGLGRVNVSLDSLRADRFAAITRSDALASVLDGIDAALDSGLDPVKVNVVLESGVNDDEVVDFAAFGRDRGVEVRFIEFMPLDADGRWTSSRVVPSAAVVEAVTAAFPADPLPSGPAPAHTWAYRDGRGRFGVIASVTEPFCGACDRVRLTADGRLRSCLFATREADLRTVLRAGGGDDAVAAAIAGEVATKWAGHRIGTPVFVRPARSMSQIGG